MVFAINQIAINAKNAITINAIIISRKAINAINENAKNAKNLSRLMKLQ